VEDAFGRNLLPPAFEVAIDNYLDAANVVGRADGSVSDVGVHDLRVGVLGDDLGWDTRVLGASAASRAGLALLLRRVDGVEPEHVGVVLGDVSLDKREKRGKGLTSAQMERTRTMGMARAELRAGKPPISDWRSRSSQAML
jgi:hypothetical protein